MTKYHKTDKDWINFKINNLTVVKKIGEKKYKKDKYEYTTDILLVRCSCGREKEYLAKSLIHNKPKTCRFCATKKIKDCDIIDKTINNNIVLKIIYDRYKNGRSVKKVLIKCLNCSNIRLVKLDTFLYGQVGCKKCLNSNKHKFNKTDINKYYKNLSNNSKKRGIKLLVDKKYLLKILKDQNNRCYYSNQHISLEDGTASVDRTDNSKGYIEDNIRWVHRSINYMKNDLPESDFIKFCCDVYLKTKERKS